MRPPARVVDNDPAWPIAFEEIRSRLEPALADVALALEHVGSTAVPGLAAKPVIDVDVVVADATQVPIAIERLAALGYEHQGDLGVVGREAFGPLPGGPYHHLYVVVEGSEPHLDHVQLRDYLRPRGATVRGGETRHRPSPGDGPRGIHQRQERPRRKHARPGSWHRASFARTRLVTLTRSWRVVSPG